MKKIISLKLCEIMIIKGVCCFVKKEVFEILKNKNK